MSAPIQSGSIGELFWRVDEAVMLVEGDRIIAWNPSAERMFNVSVDFPADAEELLAPVLGSAYPGFRKLLSDPGTTVIDALDGCGLVLDVKSWPIEGSDIRMLILTDVTSSRRLSVGLSRLSALGRELLVAEPQLPDLLQQLVDEAKSVARADYGALLLLAPDRPDVVSHFVYNAPPDLVPDRVPRAIGLLALALSARAAVSVEDIRNHSAAVGLPANHPPIGALLAAPVFAGEAIVGEIVVGNSPDGRIFDEVDEQLLLDLAAHAGIAVRWGESRERARVTHELRSEIVATARHDIRNPLTIGKGYASMLEQKRGRLSDEQIDSALSAIQTAFERIEHFAARALMADDVEAAEDSPTWQRIGVQPLLRALADDHAAAAREAEINVEARSEPGTPPDFTGDLGMVREVIDNLVTNAIKYGTRGTSISVIARGDGDHVRFDVHNAGDGIAAEDQQRIFDPYWRTDTARGSTTPGTGLGLAIVRRLVTLHHGVVGVASRPDDGTTFWVTFPVEPPSQ